MAALDQISTPKIIYLEGAAPGTPAAGLVYVYAKAGGLMYSKDDAGVETLMSAGAASQALLASEVKGSAGASFSFTGLSAAYNHLRLVLVGRCSGAVFDGGVRLRFNNDSGANYDDDATNQASATTVDMFEEFAQTSGFIGYVIGASGPASKPGVVTVDVPLYAGTTFHKSYLGNHGEVGQSTGEDRLGHVVGTWRSTAAINRLDVILSSGTNFIIGSAAYVYGIL